MRVRWRKAHHLHFIAAFDAMPARAEETCADIRWTESSLELEGHRADMMTRLIVRRLGNRPPEGPVRRSAKESGCAIATKQRRRGVSSSLQDTSVSSGISRRSGSPKIAPVPENSMRKQWDRARYRCHRKPRADSRGTGFPVSCRQP